MRKYVLYFLFGVTMILKPSCNIFPMPDTKKVACGAFLALQPVGRLYPCPIEFPLFISRGATHRIGTRDLC